MCSRKKHSNILKYKRPYKRNTANVECKNRIFASNNRDKRHQLKIIQKTSEKISKNCRKQPYWALHAYLASPVVKVQERYDISELQKTAISGTANILWKVIM